MKNIVFYLHFTKVGGAELVAMQYMQGLIEAGYKVDLIVDFDMGKDGNTFEYAIPKEIAFQYIKSQKVSSFIYTLRTLGKKNKIFTLLLYGFNILFDFYYYHTKVKKILKIGNYDTTITFYQFLPSYITNCKKMKHILWLHGSVEHFFKGFTRFFVSSYERKLDKYDFIITIAQDMKVQLQELFPKFDHSKILMIYNPFSFDDILIKSNATQDLTPSEVKLLNEDFICTVGRLDEGQKDFITLINAFEFLYKNKTIKEKLYIIGDGPNKNDLIDAVKQKNLEQNILFLGKKLNPYIWMKKAKIFILSSKFEGLPTVLIEAMTCKTFIISSSCKTGPKEILCNGKCGDLFDVGNVDELSKKIKFSLSNEEYRNQKILKATERIREFDKRISVNQLMKII